MAKSTQLLNLELNEISGVDHPANLHEGWLVLKNSNDPLEKTLANVVEEITTETTNGESQVDITHEENKVDEVEKEVTPAIDADFRKEMSDLRKELSDARAEAENVKAERALEKAVSRAQDWAILPDVTPSEFAPVLRSIEESTPEEAEVIKGILDRCATALNEAGVLKELGTSEPNETDGTAWDSIESLAKSLVESGEAKTIQDGIGQAAKANPEIYAAYVQELGA